MGSRVYQHSHNVHAVHTCSVNMLNLIVEVFNSSYVYLAEDVGMGVHETRLHVGLHSPYETANYLLTLQSNSTHQGHVQSQSQAYGDTCTEGKTLGLLYS